MRGFYRTGHYHWGYEGDLFGLYPEANYGPNLDIYNGEILGMTLYYLTYSTWKGKMMYLEDFVVKPEFRRRGIGQLLFDGFIAEAKQHMQSQGIEVRL